MKTHHQVNNIWTHKCNGVFLKISVNKVKSQVGMFGLMTLINACKKRKLLSYVKSKN